MRQRNVIIQNRLAPWIGAGVPRPSASAHAALPVGLLSLVASLAIHAGVMAGFSVIPVARANVAPLRPRAEFEVTLLSEALPPAPAEESRREPAPPIADLRALVDRNFADGRPDETTGAPPVAQPAPAGYRRYRPLRLARAAGE
ncbi:MAG: hypothetical protein U1A27_14850 [Phycisphaerae bacterium]